MTSLIEENNLIFVSKECKVNDCKNPIVRKSWLQLIPWRYIILKVQWTSLRFLNDVLDWVVCIMLIMQYHFLMIFFRFYSVIYTPPMYILPSTGTYNPNASGLDAWRGSNRLWTRTLDRHRRAGLPECVVSIMPGPPPVTTQDRTQRITLRRRTLIDFRKYYHQVRDIFHMKIPSSCPQYFNVLKKYAETGCYPRSFFLFLFIVI